MKQWMKWLFGSALFLAVIVLSVWYFSQHELIILNPKGLIGIKQRDLLWVASLLMLIVVIPVFVLMGVIVWKYRNN